MAAIATPRGVGGHSRDVVQSLELDEDEADRLARFERNFAAPMRRGR